MLTGDVYHGGGVEVLILEEHLVSVTAREQHFSSDNVEEQTS